MDMRSRVRFSIHRSLRKASAKAHAYDHAPKQDGVARQHRAWPCIARCAQGARARRRAGRARRRTCAPTARWAPRRARCALSKSSTRLSKKRSSAGSSPRNARLCSSGTHIVHKEARRPGRALARIRSTLRTPTGLACRASSSSCWCSIWFSALTMHPRRLRTAKKLTQRCAAKPLRRSPPRSRVSTAGSRSGSRSGSTSSGRKMECSAFLGSCGGRAHG